MSGQGVRLVILCEDLLHAAFARRFLLARGWHRRELQVEMCSGERGVRQRFPSELMRQRRRFSHQSVGLVVMIDADAAAVQYRVRALEAACQEEDVPPRGDAEAVMYAIPKRNTETWLAYLDRQEVNEQQQYQDYKRRFKGAEATCQPLVDALDHMCHEGVLAGSPPPSLAFTCNEFRRFARVIGEAGQS